LFTPLIQFLLQKQQKRSLNQKGITMAFKRNERVAAARTALRTAKKDARKGRRGEMPQAEESGGLNVAGLTDEQKQKLAEGRADLAERQENAQYYTKDYENVDLDEDDEFVMEGETKAKAPFKGAGGYTYIMNAEGDYEFTGPDGKKGVAKKGSNAHASIASEMAGTGSLYKAPTAASTPTVSAPSEDFVGPTLEMMDGGESEVENTFGATSEYGDQDIRLDPESPLTEDDMQVRLVYDALPADASTSITNSLRTLGSRRRTKDDPLGSARGEGYALSTEKRAAFNTILPFLEDKIDSSMPSGKASANFRRRVAGAALQRIDFDAIADGADPNAEIDKALAEAQRGYGDMMDRYREDQDASTRRNRGIIDPDMNPNTRADKYSGFGAFEYGKEGFTDLRNQAARVATAREEEEARQGRMTSGGQVLE
jgi:hypothetical protein